jgi:hypothetical protein
MKKAGVVALVVIGTLVLWCLLCAIAGTIQLDGFEAGYVDEWDGYSQNYREETDGGVLDMYVRVYELDDDGSSTWDWFGIVTQLTATPEHIPMGFDYAVSNMYINHYRTTSGDIFEDARPVYEEDSPIQFTLTSEDGTISVTFTFYGTNWEREVFDDDWVMWDWDGNKENPVEVDAGTTLKGYDSTADHTFKVLGGCAFTHWRRPDYYPYCSTGWVNIEERFST